MFPILSSLGDFPYDYRNQHQSAPVPGDPGDMAIWGYVKHKTKEEDGDEKPRIRRLC
jgi:hypothetical protein